MAIFLTIADVVRRGTFKNWPITEEILTWVFRSAAEQYPWIKHHPNLTRIKSLIGEKFRKGDIKDVKQLGEFIRNNLEYRPKVDMEFVKKIITDSLKRFDGDRAKAAAAIRRLAREHLSSGYVDAYVMALYYLEHNATFDPDPDPRPDVGLQEMTGTGAVAGYDTPFAFTKHKDGSKRALDVTKKLGFTVAKSISEEENIIT